MTNTQIRETVLRLLGSIAPDANTLVVDPHVSFHDQFEIDSVDFLRLMLELERELKVTIADVDYPRLATLAGCETYLTGRLAA